MVGECMPFPGIVNAALSDTDLVVPIGNTHKSPCVKYKSARQSPNS